MSFLAAAETLKPGGTTAHEHNVFNLTLDPGMGWFEMYPAISNSHSG